jgi:phage host-nuclease inhibitor protein Gam
MATANLQQQMNHTVQSFLHQVTDMARRAAVDALETTLGDRTARAHAGRPVGARADKRTTSELDALSERFVAFVRAHPGLRIEQINRTLGTQTKDLALPIRKLIAEGAIHVTGQKRSTRYFAGKPRKRARRSR